MQKIKGRKAIFKSILAAILAFIVICSAAFVFVGCDTDTPRIIMSITFNDNDTETNDNYEFTYRLNRKYYPQTVKHYLSLIDSGFYNNTIIHDVQSANNKMIGGAFSSVEDVKANTGNFKSLPETPISVWSDLAKTNPIQNVLYGETKNNAFEIRNGGFSNELGALGTYSYIFGQENVESNAMWNQRVYANASFTKNETRTVQYYNNTVTSMFYISTASTSLDNNYCVFGVLDNNASKTRFDEFMKAYENARKKIEGDEDTQVENRESFTEEVSSVRVKDGFTGREYQARSSNTATSSGYSNGIYLPKYTIRITSIRIKNR